MTEPKELVASAIAKDQADLEEALSELGKLPVFDASSIGSSAHALKNYLTVPGGTTELILMRLADHADAQVHVWLESVQHVTHLMGRIVDQLMDGNATAETPFRMEKFDLPTLVQRACSYYQRVADRKTISVIVRSAADVPHVWADRAPVAAILDNLLSNGVKYSLPGKQIWVQVHAADGWAVVSVQDEGPGLSLEDQTRLFQPGIRLTPRPTGDGLRVGGHQRTG